MEKLAEFINSNIIWTQLSPSDAPDKEIYVQRFLPFFVFHACEISLDVMSTYSSKHYYFVIIIFISILCKSSFNINAAFFLQCFSGS